MLTPVTSNADVLARWNVSMMDNYGTPPLALIAGRGARVTDCDGREYIDFVAGIAVNSLGHAHPDLVSAVNEQMLTLGHTSNLVASLPGITLAEQLISLLDPSGQRGGRAFFCNSGAEANEAAYKLARLTGRGKVVAARNSFHGRTLGALSLTGQPGKQIPFAPMFDGVTFVEFGDLESLRSAVDNDTAAVILEPIQGEGGVLPAPAGYLEAARAICDEHGALLILDEVQAGIGRTGRWWAHDPSTVRPDVVTLAKGLAGGIPIGACIAFGAAAQLFQPGHHGSTFGGNPVAAAAALAVLHVIERDDLLSNVTARGRDISEALAGHPLVDHVRGRGLMLGVVLSSDVAKDVELQARSRGALINACGPNVIRLVPPLVLTREDVRDGVAAILAALDAVARPEPDDL